MTLLAYLDESGNGEDSRYFVVAGYLKRRDLWDRFSRLWAGELASPKVLSYFKMTRHACPF